VARTNGADAGAAEKNERNAAEEQALI